MDIVAIDVRHRPIVVVTVRGTMRGLVHDLILLVVTEILAGVILISTEKGQFFLVYMQKLICK